ncbi:MAG: IS256 family transposase ISXax1 [Chroococcidiopsis cubana SAG 39.79]|uniref:Mutator family transposase n=1 Tax=Chroococcidiopsis cubana SAG 39.79 TaxID=388085 RepID=A0AB37U980_9CYAN|nr:IS256 family transposase [Chroococcidiopsis cubana]MDZ4876544.1 IS256 family transposase ISXax1 [Chroococcidiopsis cubana SAG 39.79]PSB63807.1 IS256 family transposase [Chroococcidiopsis cubana CCALA 043]RUT00282.1 IS256 family transposase [Chroococcidiopsis cubana SAG 39.79]
MTFRPELLDELLKGYENPGDLLGEGGILKQLTAALVERCLNAEMKTHLEEQRLEPATEGKAIRNRRNGHSRKTIKGEFGEAEISVPRDRNSEFEPIIVKKGRTRFDGFDDKILSLYARGMSTRDIQAQLQELYGVEVSPGLISNVTDAVEEERKIWQNRVIDPVYPIVYFDAIVVKVRQDGRVINKAIHLALGVNLSGTKELLGMWMTQNESAKFWLQVLTELQNRGLKDIFIACIDGLTGFPDAIEAVFPKTQVQLCIVHMVRNSLSYVSYKDRKAVAADLRPIYTATTEAEAEQQLVNFAEQWDKQSPTISRAWLTHWQRIIPLFAFPPEICKAIYTTNAIESMNMTLRKVMKTHRAFPTDESALKVIYLAIQNIAKKWTMPIRDWKPALNRFAIEFSDRFPS